MRCPNRPQTHDTGAHVPISFDAQLIKAHSSELDEPWIEADENMRLSVMALRADGCLQEQNVFGPRYSRYHLSLHSYKACQVVQKLTAEDDAKFVHEGRRVEGLCLHNCIT